VSYRIAERPRKTCVLICRKEWDVHRKGKRQKSKKVNIHKNRVVDVVDISTDMFAESMHVEKNDAGWPETLRIACV